MKNRIFKILFILGIVLFVLYSIGNSQEQSTYTTPAYSPTPPTPTAVIEVEPITATDCSITTVECSTTTPQPSRGAENDLEDIKPIVMIATTYDLSYASCKKNPDHPEYGITYSGKKATENRTVATDPKVIPLGTEMYIEFPLKYAYLNGVYIAEDIGSAIKGNRIDVFIGESAYEECMEFGLQEVKVYILNEVLYE